MITAFFARSVVFIALVVAIIFILGIIYARAEYDYEDNGFGEEKGNRMFECGDVLVNHTHVTDVEVYTIQVSAWHKLRDRKGPLPVVIFNSRNRTLTVNGVPCVPLR